MEIIILQFQFRAFKNQIAKIHLINGGGEGGGMNLAYVLRELRFSMNFDFFSHKCMRELVSEEITLLQLCDLDICINKWKKISIFGCKANKVNK